MLGTIANQDAPPTILDILQVEGEHFARAQSSVQHQQDHRSITPQVKGLQQLCHLLFTHRARHVLDGFDAHATADWSLSTCMTHKWLMPVGDTSASRVISLLNGILSLRELV